MTQLDCAILLCSLSTQCWRSFYELQSFWCQVFWSFFFHAELRLNIYYSVRAHTAMTLCNSTLRYQAQLSVRIFHSRLSTWRLQTYLKIGAQSFGVLCRISHPVVSVLHAYCHHMKCILLLLQFEIFSAFTLQGITSSKLLPIIYWSNDFFNRLYIQASPRASTFVKYIFATTCGIHTTEFAPRLLNHLCVIAMFTFKQLHSIWAAFMLPTSSHCTNSVASALRYSHAAALMPHQRSTRKTLCQRSRRTHEKESLWGCIEILDSCRDLCNIVYMQKAAAQQDAWTQRCARRGAARRVRSLQCSKWIFSFCTEFFPCSLTRGKNPVCREKKNGTEPWKNSVAGAGPLGWSGQGGPGRDGWPGWDWGPLRAGSGRGGGRGTCVFLHKMCVSTT